MDFTLPKAKKFIEAASVELEQKDVEQEVSWNVRLPASVLARAKMIAKSEGRSLNAQLARFVTKAVNNYVEEN